MQWFLNGLLRRLPLRLWLAPFVLVSPAAAPASSPAPGPRFISLAAGWEHSLALKADGTVVAWGGDGKGQRTVPRGLTGVVALAAGRAQSLALVGDSTALAVQASGDQVLLSWPLWARSFALQATPNLADETSWTPGLTAPVVEGSQHRVTDPISAPAKFYRLQK